MNETKIEIIGNLTADPELRYTQNGLPVCNFTVASTPRNFDRQTNEWKDGEALFMRCSAWRDLGEHIAGSLTKGARVIVTGVLKQRSYQDREGNNRTAIEIEVEDIGASLKYATAQITRAGQGAQRQQPAQQSGGDAWATPGGGGEQWAAPGAYGDDTPF